MAVLISAADIADAIELGFRRAFEQLDIEQAVRGHDVCHEVELHSIIATSLRDADFGVHREQRYPMDRRKRSMAEGERCDFVLTPDGRDLIHPDCEGTLFDTGGVALDEAFWLEVKVVSQFTLEGANANYASELMSCVRKDVTKLAKDQGILRAGLLLVLFVRDGIVGDHDLRIWQSRCLDRGLPIGAPSIRRVPITDRHGHGLCLIAVYPVSHL